MGRLSGRGSFRRAVDEHVRAADRPLHPAARLRGAAMMRSRRVRAALSLTLLGLLAALLLSGIDRLTRERIAQAEQRRALATLTELVPAERFDNDPVTDRIELRVPPFEQPATVYRARRGGEPVALIFDVTTPRGYSGDIRLLVATDPEGVVLGARVLAHRETPGLGDRIEIERSDWIRQFSGRRLGDPAPDAWAPDRRGGEFDTLTTATITTDAVIDAIKRALQVRADRSDELWTRESSGQP
ncbi:MAG: RnfABCDGE type electron transport complex subunit G [Wenzhouxiangella sp.]|nr:MAG: RnfABCDGE type electron transport complex subunit G [Wenzhouxiangella sp.]